MSLKAEVLDALLAAGATAEMIVAAVKADMADEERRKEEKRQKDAARQRKSRSNRGRHRPSRDVTVTECDPPIDNNHTPTVSNETVKRSADEIAKPDDVSEPIWSDWTKHRKAKRAKITETAMAGIRREAEKAGWSMDAALSKAMERGWTGFEAAWVADQPIAKQNRDPPSFLQHMIEDQRRRREWEATR